MCNQALIEKILKIVNDYSIDAIKLLDDLKQQNQLTLEKVLEQKKGVYNQIIIVVNNIICDELNETFNNYINENNLYKKCRPQ